MFIIFIFLLEWFVCLDVGRERKNEDKYSQWDFPLEENLEVKKSGIEEAQGSMQTRGRKNDFGAIMKTWCCKKWEVTKTLVV